VMEFPSIEDAQSWYTSEDYRAIAPLRTVAAASRAVLVAGYQPTK
jgi:uncharacterized protein (DUF1330 family)